jgi:diguanylate cyclase (GGDEF)-like protein/PAS domain S-box-containing protein
MTPPGSPGGRFPLGSVRGLRTPFARNARHRLADSEHALADVQRLAAIGSFELDLPSRHMTWSDELYRIFGRDKTDCTADYEAWLSSFHPHDRGIVDVAIARAGDSSSACSFVHRVVRPDGATRTVDCRIHVETDERGSPLRLHGTVQDITSSALAEERFRSLFENAPYAQVIIDEEGRIALVNAHGEHFFGYRREELIGRRVEDVVPRRPGAAGAWFEEALATSGQELELIARRSTGAEFPVEVSLTPLPTEEGMLISAALKDVTERKLAAEALAHQASHDSLTGLPNRALLLDRLEHALARARRSESKLAVVFLDLDDFKLVNDTRGHETGDLLLVTLTPRLSAALRPGDTISRFGGDEFVVLCEDLASESDAVAITRRILDACRQPITIGGYDHTVTVSAGVVVVKGGTATPSAILRDADAAMYRAKATGKGRVEVFDEGMRTRLLERIAIESELQHGLENGELRLYYQPVMAIPDGGIVAAEALIRWQHPTRGLLEPAEFVPVAESSGLIVPIGEWVIREACHQAAEWRDADPRGRGVPVSVNVSAGQLIRADVAASVRRILAATRLDPSMLGIEITESMLLEDNESTARALRDLKGLGVRLVLDDFGTGYSSLSYLRRYTIDALKIDRSFVGGLGRDAGDGAIVSAVLSMAQALKIPVTAEGVETATQLDRLLDDGCELAQGYLLSRPVTAGEMRDLLPDHQIREELTA